MPFFRDVAVGCYVRVGIGAHEGRMVYRVRQPHATTHTLFCRTTFCILICIKNVPNCYV